MNYGLYVSASGVLANLHRQDVAANNLANAQTVGFKESLAAIKQRDAESVEDGLSFEMSHRLLDRLGGGVFVADSRVSGADGPMDATGNALDIAVRGEGFLVVGGLEGREGLAGEAALTRDGRLTMASDGRLEMTANGRPVLGVNGEPIVLDPTLDVHIDEVGAVNQGGAEIGRLHLLVPSEAGLRHLGDGLYAIEGDEELGARERGGGQIRQGYLEQSNVNEITELTRLIGATKAATSNANMIRYHDLMMDRAVNVLGRVA